MVSLSQKRESILTCRVEVVYAATEKLVCTIIAIWGLRVEIVALEKTAS